MNPGALVVISLAQPSEKYWGVLENLQNAGVTIRGINLSSFEDWVQEITGGGEPSMGLATVFFPLHRVIRMALDEPMGQVESLGQSFERRVGTSIEAYLGLGTDDLTPPN